MNDENKLKKAMEKNHCPPLLVFRGPMLGKLKNGESVTLEDGSVVSYKYNV